MKERRLGKPISRLFRVALVIVGLSMGLLSAWLNGRLHGWGLPTLTAAAGVVIPTIYYRPQWRHRWFWLVVIPIAVLQVPMIIVAKPLMDQLKFVALTVFAILDGCLVAVVVNWVSPKSQEGDDNQK